MKRMRFSNIMKGWWRVDTVASIVLLVTIGCLLVSFIGFPKELDETVEACVYTESGEAIAGQVRIDGEVTRYPFKGYEQYDLDVYWESVRIFKLQNISSKAPYAYWQTYRLTSINDIQKEILVVETDIQVLFPERESQRCLIVSPTVDMETAMKIVKDSAASETIKAQFAWCEAQNAEDGRLTEKE